MQLVPPNQAIDSAYDVIVVGSGYGAAVAAMRSAEFGKRVALLERGREFRHGDFPATTAELLGDLRIHGTRSGRADGLFELMPFRDLTVLKGGGLGGGSLINAGVAERPKPGLSENPAWPAALREDAAGLEQGYERSAAMLEITPYPHGQPGFPALRKTEAFRNLAHKHSAEFHLPSLAIHFGAPGYNRSGKFQETCTNCGNCFTGCNYAAKNSLDKNYLARARQLGAELHTGIEVSHVRKLESEGEWLVYYHATNSKRASDPPRTVRAREVYLGAGAPGSTEILLRSRELSGLALSERLGHSFSANSGSFGGVYNSDQSFGMFGLSKHMRGDRRVADRAAASSQPDLERRGPGKARTNGYAAPVGPTITGLLRDGGDAPEKQFVIEDSAIPSALVPFAGSWWPLVAGIGRLFSSASAEGAGSWFNPFAAGSSHGMFLVVGHDDAGGRITLQAGGALRRANLVWPGLASRPNYRAIADRLRQLLRDYGGIFNSARALAMLNPITVHPLGGCAMSADSTSGVCDHAGRVWNPAASSSQATPAYHAGLYVCDASLFPASLGTNPFWTIAALAERALAIHNEVPHMQTHTTQPVGASGPGSEPAKTLAPGARLSLSEQMSGCWSRHKSNATDGRAISHAEAYRQGEARGLGGRVELNLELVIGDLHRFFEDPEHRTELFGTIDIPALSANGPLTITEGSFALFAPHSGAARDRVMHYRFRAIDAETEEHYDFTASKQLKAGALLQALESLTTAELSVYRAIKDSDSSVAPAKLELGRGLIHIDLSRFFTHTAWDIDISLDAGSGPAFRERGRLYAFFAEQLARLYGPPRILRPADELKPPPAKIERYTEAGIRPDATIESIPFLSDDGLGLLLRRVRMTQDSGSPAVLLVHGLTSSADMFIMPEHENLTNVLLDQGYEVWLLDFRMSNRFAYNTMQHRYSFDDVALFDMPAAVRQIRARIGPDATLHAVAHCLGSVGISMASFAGLLTAPESRLDSLVSNSISLAVELPELSALRLQGLIGTGFLEKALRTHTVDPEALHQTDWLTGALARGLAAYHQECDNSACHMLSFMWGSGRSAVFEHENLSPITHDRLAQLFGPTGFQYYKHVLKMHHTKAKAAPRFHQAGHNSPYAQLPEDYFSGLETNQTPMLFISGDRNKVFARSQERMFARCQASKRPELYRYALIEGYGHQDIFMGRQSARDVFGLFLDYWQSLPPRPHPKQSPPETSQAHSPAQELPGVI